MRDPRSPEAAPLDGARVERAGAVLARAFHDYPLFRELFPDERRREPALRWYLGFVVRYCSRHGEVFTAAGDAGFLAVLTGPRPFTRRKLLAAGLLLGPLRMGVVPFWRMMRQNNYVAQVSSGVVPPGAWYLWIVGVDPAAQSQQLGGALMRRLLQAADAAGAAISVDTDRRGMLGFLALHGFRVVHEGRAPATGLPFWVALRPAAPSRPPGS